MSYTTDKIINELNQPTKENNELLHDLDVLEKTGDVPSNNDYLI